MLQIWTNIKAKSAAVLCNISNPYWEYNFEAFFAVFFQVKTKQAKMIEATKFRPIISLNSQLNSFEPTFGTRDFPTPKINFDIIDFIGDRKSAFYLSKTHFDR